tara:strand:- start:739 stop:912 length:174 start_codon:yes stop_codon:yes gene_type:complete
MMSGKGDKARPLKDRAKFDKSWDDIFGPKKGAFGSLTETEKRKENDKRANSEVFRPK